MQSPIRGILDMKNLNHSMGLKSVFWLRQKFPSLLTPFCKLNTLTSAASQALMKEDSEVLLCSKSFSTHTIWFLFPLPRTSSCDGHTALASVPGRWVSGAWNCRNRLECTPCRERGVLQLVQCKSRGKLGLQLNSQNKWHPVSKSNSLTSINKIAGFPWSIMYGKTGCLYAEGTKTNHSIICTIICTIYYYVQPIDIYRYLSIYIYMSMVQPASAGHWTFK